MLLSIVYCLCALAINNKAINKVILEIKPGTDFRMEARPQGAYVIWDTLIQMPRSSKLGTFPELFVDYVRKSTETDFGPAHVPILCGHSPIVGRPLEPC